MITHHFISLTLSIIVSYLYLISILRQVLWADAPTLP